MHVCVRACVRLYVCECASQEHCSAPWGWVSSAPSGVWSIRVRVKGAWLPCCKPSVFQPRGFIQWKPHEQFPAWAPNNKSPLSAREQLCTCAPFVHTYSEQCTVLNRPPTRTLSCSCCAASCCAPLRTWDRPRARTPAPMGTPGGTEQQQRRRRQRQHFRQRVIHRNRAVEHRNRAVEHRNRAVEHSADSAAWGAARSWAWTAWRLQPWHPCVREVRWMHSAQASCLCLMSSRRQREKRVKSSRLPWGSGRCGHASLAARAAKGTCAVRPPVMGLQGLPWDQAGAGLISYVGIGVC